MENQQTEQFPATKIFSYFFKIYHSVWLASLYFQKRLKNKHIWYIDSIKWTYVDSF